jgi:hypothetical protein
MPPIIPAMEGRDWINYFEIFVFVYGIFIHGYFSLPSFAAEARDIPRRLRVVKGNPLSFSWSCIKWRVIIVFEKSKQFESFFPCYELATLPLHEFELHW